MLRGTQQQGDLDNYAKSILDALNTIAYVDDRQIVRLEIDMKRASADPGVSVEIWRYEDDE